MSESIQLCKEEGKFASLRQNWQSFREFMGLTRIISTYVLSHIVTFPKGDFYQVGMDTFIECLAMPENPVGNILIIQGGTKHMDPDSYYVRTAGVLMKGNARVFLFEKCRPVINFNFGHDIADVLKFIKEKYPGPTTVIGYSMGGILLLSYLALGYNQADLYIPTCCALDLRDFSNAISSNWLFRFVEERECKMFGVKNKHELYKMAGTSTEETEKFMDTFMDRLNKYKENWVDKTIYVIGSDDPISADYQKWLDSLEKSPLTYVVEGGWHCCLNTVFLTIELACNYIKDLHEGKKTAVKNIKYI